MPGKAGQRGQEGVAGTSDQKSDRGGEEGTPEKRAEVLRFGDLGGKRRNLKELKDIFTFLPSATMVDSMQVNKNSLSPFNPFFFFSP